MRIRNLLIAIILIAFWGAVSAQGQSRDLTKLATRAAEYWKLTVAGERVKASSYITAAKREGYLNSSSLRFLGAEVVGLQFTGDASRVIVKIAVRTVEGSESGPAGTEQPWVWINNNWFVELADSNPFVPGSNKPSADSATVAEIEKQFQLKTTHISVGTVWHGSNPEFPVEFEYTGKEPLRIAGDSRVPFIGIDPPSSQVIPEGAKSFKLRVDTTDYDGPFALAVQVTIFYKDVAIRKSINVDGTIFHPVRVVQVPDAVASVAGTRFEIKIQNQLDIPVAITAFNAFGAFDVASVPEEVPAKGEAIVNLSVRSSTAADAMPLRLQVAIPEHGFREILLKVRTKSPQ